MKHPRPRSWSMAIVWSTLMYCKEQDLGGMWALTLLGSIWDTRGGIWYAIWRNVSWEWRQWGIPAGFRRERCKRPRCVAHGNLFKHGFVNNRWIDICTGKVRIFLGGPWTWIPNLKPLRKPWEKMVNCWLIWMALKVGCQFVNVNGGGRGESGEVIRSILRKNCQSLKTILVCPLCGGWV